MLKCVIKREVKSTTRQGDAGFCRLNFAVEKWLSALE